MEHVLDALGREGGSYVCTQCGHVLGPETGDYRLHALRFDESINAGEPTELYAVSADEYVLRHYCCPECATLFEVEMRPIDAPAARSVQLGVGDGRRQR